METWAETFRSRWKIVRSLKVPWEEECYGTPDSAKYWVYYIKHSVPSRRKWWHPRSFWESEAYWRKCKSHTPAQTRESMGSSWWEIRVDGCRFWQPCGWWVASPRFQTPSVYRSYSALGAMTGERFAFWNHSFLLVKIPSFTWMCPCSLVCSGCPLWAVGVFFFLSFPLSSLLTWHLI